MPNLTQIGRQVYKLWGKVHTHALSTVRLSLRNILWRPPIPNLDQTAKTGELRPDIRNAVSTSVRLPTVTVLMLVPQLSAKNSCILFHIKSNKRLTCCYLFPSTTNIRTAGTDLQPGRSERLKYINYLTKNTAYSSQPFGQIAVCHKTHRHTVWLSAKRVAVQRIATGIETVNLGTAGWPCGVNKLEDANQHDFISKTAQVGNTPCLQHLHRYTVSTSGLTSCLLLPLAVHCS